MSYTATSGLTVGTKAARDPILAQASLDAATILRGAAGLPRARRPEFVERKLRAYGPGAAGEFRAKVAGTAGDQALYDALRLAIADQYARAAISYFESDAVRARGAEALGAMSLGKRIGCGVTGGVTAIGGAVATFYTGGAGGNAVTTGGSMVGGALNCDKAQRESAERIAQSQAAAAQAQLDAARVAAEAQERAAAATAAERTKQIKVVAVIGGGLLALLAAGYAIVKV